MSRCCLKHFGLGILRLRVITAFHFFVSFFFFVLFVFSSIYLCVFLVIYFVFIIIIYMRFYAALSLLQYSNFVCCFSFLWCRFYSSHACHCSELQPLLCKFSHSFVLLLLLSFQSFCLVPYSQFSFSFYFLLFVRFLLLFYVSFKHTIWMQFLFLADR